MQKDIGFGETFVTLFILTCVRRCRQFSIKWELGSYDRIHETTLEFGDLILEINGFGIHQYRIYLISTHSQLNSRRLYFGGFDIRHLI